MRSVISLCLLIYAIQPQLRSQQIPVNTFHPFSGAVVFSAEAGGTYPFTDLSFPVLDIFGRGLIEYYFPSKFIHTIGIRVLGGGGYLSSEGEVNNREFNHRTGFFFIGGGLTYAFRIGNGVPYVSATMSYLLFDPRDGEGYLLPYNRENQFDQNALMQSVELGMRFPFAEVLSLNLGINMNFTYIDNLDAVEKGSNNDVFASAFVGISLYVREEKDSDGDGVDDDKDICPSTPLGLEVDEFGCPKENPPMSATTIFEESNFIPDTLLIIEDQGEGISNDKILSTKFFTDGKLHCFQLSLFKDKNVADKEAKNLSLDGHNAIVIEAYPFKNNQVWYRLIIGYFNTFEEARAYKKQYFK